MTDLWKEEYNRTFVCIMVHEKLRILMYLRIDGWPGVVAHACNLKHFERPGWADHSRPGVQDQPGQHGETSSILKIQKLSQAWWHVPVIPATWVAEAEESLKPRRQRLQ